MQYFQEPRGGSRLEVTVVTQQRDGCCNVLKLYKLTELIAVKENKRRRHAERKESQEKGCKFLTIMT